MVQQQGGSAGQAAAPVLAGSASGCMPAAAPLAHVAGQALQAGAREPAASGASGPVADAAADRALAHLRQRLPEVAALYARLRSQPCKDSGASSGKEPRPRAARRKALAAQQRLPAGALARAADGGEAASTATDGGSSAAAGTRAAAVGDSPGELGAHQNGALNSRLSQQQTAPVAPAELGQPRHAAGPLPQQAAGASVTDGESLPAAAPPEPQRRVSSNCQRAQPSLVGIRTAAPPPRGRRARLWARWPSARSGCSGWRWPRCAASRRACRARSGGPWLASRGSGRSRVRARRGCCARRVCLCAARASMPALGRHHRADANVLRASGAVCQGCLCT